MWDEARYELWYHTSKHGTTALHHNKSNKNRHLLVTSNHHFEQLNWYTLVKQLVNFEYPTDCSIRVYQSPYYFSYMHLFFIFKWAADNMIWGINIENNWEIINLCIIAEFLCIIGWFLYRVCVFCLFHNAHGKPVRWNLIVLVC